MRLEKNKIYSSKQLAEGFSINPSTLSRNREEYLEILKNFAAYEEVGKRIKITEVYLAEYNKQGNNNYNKVKNKVPEVGNANGLDSSTRVSQEIQHQLMLPLNDSTVYRYTLKSRNELYGKPFRSAGELGRCTYTWCKKVGEGYNAQIIPLTPEEEEIKRKIIQKYYGESTEKQIIVKAMVENGEIRKEEAWEVLEELTNMSDRDTFFAFMAELQEKLNCRVIRGTQVYLNSAIEEGYDWSDD